MLCILRDFFISFVIQLFFFFVKIDFRNLKINTLDYFSDMRYYYYNMQYVIYSVIALIACMLGSVSGMGGGVIVKPMLDLLGQYDPVTINLLSSITVFSMSIVSVLKSIGKSDIKNETWTSPSRLVVLSLGGVLGGYIGQFLFDMLLTVVSAHDSVVVIQNVIFLIITIFIFLFTLFSARLKTYKFQSYIIYALTGIFLGLTSAFLGIGGGAINVSMMMFMFSFDMKTSVFASILVIFFSQLSKLLSVLFTTGFGDFDLSIAPAMIIAAIIGGFVGTSVKKRSSNETVTKLFNGIQIFIMGICVVNIVKSIM